MNKQRIPLVLSGACGRMGTTLRNLVAQSDEFTLVAAVERADHPLQGKVLPENLLLQKTLPEGRYVIIDFSLPEATATLLAEACRLRNPLVIGTTGLQEPLKQKIGEISSTIPVLYASNMSFGVNCFFEIVKQAARLLNDYEVEIVETHHHHKKDAPSGT
ncbi:MAG TPA: 4-hydroxy-tetrahydrodipicolinate reductase, partial [bacterium]|nr:4-hydroxy-tetrahydrodipicolinate reductase [bacterium]